MLLLNYKPVLRQPTGIGVYANAVLPALKGFEHCLIPGGGSGGSKERLKRLAWSQFQLPRLARERKADLIFTPAPEGYLGEQVVPQVVMVHDLRPLVHADKSLQSIYFKHWVPALLRKCSLILTNSNYTSEQLITEIGVDSSRILSAHLGYDSSHFLPREKEDSLGSRNPYILSIGQHYPHKNLFRAINAFKSVSQRFANLEFWIVGKTHPSETARLLGLTHELGLHSRVRFIKYLPYSQLPIVYANASLLLYPSLYEGFGLPIIEAMACATPVITSYGSATEETAGNAALLVNPFQTEDISYALDQLLSTPPLARSLVKLGLSRAHSFSWDAARKNVVTAISAYC